MSMEILVVDGFHGKGDIAMGIRAQYQRRDKELSRTPRSPKKEEGLKGVFTAMVTDG
jgi:hypothetical protein